MKQSGAAAVPYYVINGKGTFVIVAGDDVALPILGYSDESEFDVRDIPINRQQWLAGYEEEMEAIYTYNIEQSETARNAWSTVASQQTARRSGAPLIQTKWNQNPYYNAYCPGGSVVGCVATAMAQIMKYYNWPRQGVGSSSYNTSGYGTLSVNYGNTTYNWEAMPQYVSSNNYQATALLSYNCGVAVQMSYSPYGSAAWQENVTTALKNYFRYAQTVRNVYKSNYSYSGWVAMLQAEIDAGRPVQYAGNSSDIGHSFVCDAYDGEYFHFNWGWGGMSDGYFLTNALNPGSLGTGGGSAGGFNAYQTCVIGIKPEGAADPTPPTPTPPTPSPTGADKYEPNNTVAAAYDLNGSFGGYWTLQRNTQGSTIHNASDVDYYKLKLSGGNYYMSLNVYVQDQDYNTDGGNYTLNAVCNLSTDGGRTWSQDFYDYATGVPVQPGATVLVKVGPYYKNQTGNYKLDITVGASPRAIMGTTEESVDPNTKVYPNPVSDVLHVKGDYRLIEIFDVAGKAVKTGKGSSVNVKDLPAGIYIVRLSDGKNISSHKVIKK